MSRLPPLDRERPGFYSDVKAEVERLTDDLTTIVDNYANRADAVFQPDRQRR